MNDLNYIDAAIFVGYIVETNERSWLPVKDVSDAKAMLTYLTKNGTSLRYLKGIYQSSAYNTRFSTEFIKSNSGRTLYDIVMENKNSIGKSIDLYYFEIYPSIGEKLEKNRKDILALQGHNPMSAMKYWFIITVSILTFLVCLLLI